MTAVVVEAGENGKAAKSRLPAWLRVIALTAAGLLIAAAIWVVYSSELIVGDATHRNFHELEVAAKGLEAWPNSLRGLAKANFIKSNIQVASAKDRADGWIGVAHVWHPLIGPYDLLYQIELAAKPGKLGDAALPTPCAGVLAQAEKSGRMRLPFVASTRAGEGPQLKVIGSIPLRELWIASHAETASVPDPESEVDIDDIFKTTLMDAAGKQQQPISSTLCYSSVVPIAKLLAFDRTGQQFTDLMIVDGDRRVVRQIGSRQIAVDTLDKLAPAGSILDAAFAKSSTDKSTKPETPQLRLADALKPVPIDIAGESYLAYVRPFHLPPGVLGCESVTKSKTNLNLALAVGDASVDSSETVKRASDDAPDHDAPVAQPEACLLVGLMPNHLLMRSALTLSPVPLVVFGFIAAITLALLPTARLLLIGTGDGLPGYAAAGVVLGIPMAAGFAALALLFAMDVVRERAGTRNEAVAVALDMANKISGELKSAISRAASDSRNNQNVLEPFGNETLSYQKTQDLFNHRKTLDPVDKVTEINLDPQQVPDTISGENPLPVVESIAAIDSHGSILACGARTLQFRNNAAAWPDVGGRDYFTRIRDGHTDGVPGKSRYVVAQVRSQTDGINKTIIAFPYNVIFASKGIKESEPGPCSAAVILASTVLPSLVAPILPQPLGFMVIDSRDIGGQPYQVLFHDQPEHAGVENLGTELDVSGLRHLREWLSSGPRQVTAAANTASRPPETTFTGRYGGATRRFVAARIAGTSWVLLVNYALDDVDAVAAATAARATQAWLAVGGFLVMCWLLLIWASTLRGDGWRSLWPHEPLTPARSRDQGEHEADSNTDASSPYRRYPSLAGTLMLFIASGHWPSAPWAVLATAAGTVVLVLAISHSPLVLGVLLMIAAGLYVLYSMRLGGTRPTTALTPRTEQRYRLMVIAFIGCVIIIPVEGFWHDARTFTLMQAEAQSLAALTGPEGGIDRRHDAISDIQRAFDLNCTKQSDSCPNPDAMVGRYLPLDPSKVSTRDPVDGLSSVLWYLGGHTPAVRPLGCMKNFAPEIDTQCISDTLDEQISGLVQHRTPLVPGGSQSVLGLVSVAFAAFGLAVFFWWLIGKVLRALFGFGIALEGVTRPILFMGAGTAPRGSVALPTRALIVGAPDELRARFIRPCGKGRAGPAGEDWTVIDLAGTFPSTELRRPPTAKTAIVVFGLELIIRDTERRRRALEQLEQLDTRVGSFAGSYLVILSVLSPIERILDAYEQDRNEPAADVSLAKYREQLRWGRVFERFTTFGFAPVEHIDRDYLQRPDMWPKDDQEAWAVLSKHQQQAIAQFLDETRWLPTPVIESVVCTAVAIPANLDDIYPVDPQQYQKVLTPLVVSWALRLKAESPQAAIDYLRGAVIEHYQKCWSASTFAERVVLDRLAHGQFVNVDRAVIPLSSLVRRGLIVFDPAPQLMNRSFAMFVRQAERPERIESWRRKQPAGAWATARLPILIAVPSLVMLLLASVLWSGQDVTSLLPLLATGAPALLLTLSRGARRATD